MGLRVFSVVGEALNFGARRMPTIMRVAWLPIALLLVFEMAAVFSYLSIIAGRLITFSDATSFLQAKAALAKYGAAGFEKHPVAMYAISSASGVINAVLVSSFMAPLVRYSGLGEKPSPGVVKLEFGQDQIRYLLAALIASVFLLIFIFAPIAGAAYFVVKYIVAALSQTYASFPNPESLHTIELVTGRDVLANNGNLWLYETAIPLAVAAFFAIGFWVILVMHFHPNNRGRDGEGGNVFFRAATALASLAIILGFVWLLAYTPAAKAGAADFAYLPALYVLAALILLYFNLRIIPYQGVVVCRRSMAPAGTLRATRGWNVVKLFVAIVMIVAIMGVMLILINTYVFGFAKSAANLLYQATASATKLVHHGAESEWVRPLWIWLWNGFKILANIFWAFFTYGVSAGLLGRLYRESEVDA